MLARYYGNNQARFLSVDPAPASATRPQTWNRYIYSRNNPVRFLDPDGRKEKDPTDEQREELLEVPGTATPRTTDEGEPNPDAYNCHSFCFHDSKGDPTDQRNDPAYPLWDNYPDDDLGEFDKLDPDEPNKLNDRVIYGNDANGDGVLQPEEMTHSGYVAGVDDEGNTTAVAGKWGFGPVRIHHPAQARAEAEYGTTREYYRPKQQDSTKPPTQSQPAEKKP